MGYKILDVKEDIKKDISDNLERWVDVYKGTSTIAYLEEELLDIVDKHFEKIERL